MRHAPNRGVRGKNVGKFFSIKMGRVLWFESLLEESLMYLLDFDSGVKSFREQPCRIRYLLHGKVRRYTPDLLVERAGQKQIIEVKPKRKVNTEKYDLLFRIISTICEMEGYKFKVYTEEVILQQPRLNNIKAVWGYARTPLHLQYQIYSYELLQLKHEVSLAEVFEYFQMRKVSKQVVYALLYWGVMGFDLNEPLCPNSRIYLPDNATAASKKESCHA